MITLNVLLKIKELTIAADLKQQESQFMIVYIHKQFQNKELSKDNKYMNITSCNNNNRGKNLKETL